MPCSSRSCRASRRATRDSSSRRDTSSTSSSRRSPRAARGRRRPGMRLGRVPRACARARGGEDIRLRRRPPRHPRGAPRRALAGPRPGHNRSRRRAPRAGLPKANVVATNPPFAGRADASGFEVARVVRTPERDVLFLERALDLLRPGGRLGIVLPYNKAAGASFAALRRWLVGARAHLAVVGLPRETFLPHTSQRTFVLFAKRRAAGEKPEPARARDVRDQRAGREGRRRRIRSRGAKAATGSITISTTCSPSSRRFSRRKDSRREGRRSRRSRELAPDYVLAPERHVVAAGARMPRRASPACRSASWSSSVASASTRARPRRDRARHVACA